MTVVAETSRDRSPVAPFGQATLLGTPGPRLRTPAASDLLAVGFGSATVARVDGRLRVR
jgi:hypothetical protein